MWENENSLGIVSTVSQNTACDNEDDLLGVQNNKSHQAGFPMKNLESKQRPYKENITEYVKLWECR